jgi:RNA polymerase subunit RPABC4/transcription elongation factor Spt4
MGFFDDIGKKVTEVAGDVSKSAKSLADAARLNSQISTEKKKANAALLELGRRYYDAYRDTPPEGLASVFATAKEALTKVSELELELIAAKGLKACPSCGNTVVLTTNFCPNCGASVPTPEPPAEPEEEAVPICTNCGAPISEDSAFCTVCGVPVTTAE